MRSIAVFSNLMQRSDSTESHARWLQRYLQELGQSNYHGVHFARGNSQISVIALRAAWPPSPTYPAMP